MLTAVASTNPVPPNSSGTVSPSVPNSEPNLPNRVSLNVERFASVVLERLGFHLALREASHHGAQGRVVFGGNEQFGQGGHRCVVVIGSVRLRRRG